MGKFMKTIHFIIFIKLFFINYPYLGAEDEENCCITICPCFRNFKDKLEKEKKKLEEENKNLKQEKGTLEKENKNLKQEKEDLEEEKKKIAEKENNFNIRENELNQKEEHFNNEMFKLANEKNLLIDENNKFKELLEVAEKEKKKYEEENNKLKQEKENNLQNNEGNLLNKEKSNLEEEKKILNQKYDELKQKQKELEDKNILLKQDQKNFLNEKEKFNTIKTQLTQKDNEIKNHINQLNIRQNKIQQKEGELVQREKVIIEKEKKYKIVLIGLNNIGATCYMNATLQCLSNSKKLTEYFLTKYQYDPNDQNKIMTNEYYKVLKNLWDTNSKEKAYSPISFKEVLSKENPLFAGVAANDSKDLINFLLERFHQELNVINPNINLNNNNNDLNPPDQTNEMAMLGEFLKENTQKFNSPISNLFYGILETKSQCQGCNIIKYNFQVYSFLEFPLQQVNQYYFNLGKKPLILPNNKNPDVDLYECFDYNGKIDLMTGENQMYCNICNKLCNAYYSTILYSGPNNLIINLNRGKGAVYECKVNFPNQLNIFNYVSFKHGITVYELYAVICHLGPSSMSGHFVAYCKNRIDNQWYLYNDGIVTKCSRQFQYNDGMPYILFYRGLSSD